jgi:hypothetical protein
MIAFPVNLIRSCLRFLGLCLLAAAFIMFIIDAKRSYMAATLYLTPASEALAAFAPGQWAAAQNFFERHDHLMNAISAELSRWPAWLLLAVCGVLAAWLGKRPRPKFGFSSR